MKSKNPLYPYQRGGFTLVELLVVIAIVAVLAATAMTVGPKMLAKARATEAMQNLRQFGPLLTSYASEHSMKLPAIRADVVQPDGTSVNMIWHEVCLAMVYPDEDIQNFKSKTWWESRKIFMKNPQFKASAGWTPQNPGYAFNAKLLENIATNAGRELPNEEELLTMQVSMTNITEPSRAPVVTPYTANSFRNDPAEINAYERAPLKDFLTDNRMSVLFLDGHVESVGIREYITRDLYLEPKASGQ